MNVQVISVGKNKDKEIKKKLEHYTKISGIKIELTEIKDSNPTEEENKFKELIENMDNSYVITMSEEGDQLTSREFSSLLNKESMTHKKIVFCIGGPNGFNKPISFGDKTISLSKMTFTHEMCQLFLFEQIYRAISIIEGKKYHRD